MERQTEAAPVSILCTNNRLLIMEDRRWLREFRASVGWPRSYDAVRGWIKRFNEHTLESKNFIIAGEAHASFSETSYQKSASLDVAIAFHPKAGRGETAAQLKAQGCEFRKYLEQEDPTEVFIYFMVRPDSLEAFEAGREMAASLGFESGWSPNDSEDGRVRFTFTGEGIEAVSQ